MGLNISTVNHIEQYKMNAENLTALVGVIAWAYIILAIVASIFLAQLFEKRLKLKSPALLPYRWGYFFGLVETSFLLWALFFGVMAVLLAAAQQWEICGEMIAVTVWCGTQGIAGWFIIKRKRWAWAVGTVASLNLIFWIINCIYTRKRWKELS